MDFPIWAMVATTTSRVIINIKKKTKKLSTCVAVHDHLFYIRGLLCRWSNCNQVRCHPTSTQSFLKIVTKGPDTRGENNMSPGPHLVLWQQIYSPCKGRAKRGHVWRLITGDFPVWSQPRRLNKKVDIWPSVLLMTPAVMTTEAGCRSGLPHSPINRDGVSAPAFTVRDQFLSGRKIERNETTDASCLFLSVFYSSRWKHAFS